MLLRRGPVQDRGRAAQCPHLPLPQLPEGDGLAVLCPRAVRPAGAFVEGDTARYPSSEALDRVFCKVCGTRLFSRRTNGTVVGVALAVFDDRNAFAPTEHIWVSEKMAWVRLDDGLPQYQETVP